MTDVETLLAAAKKLEDDALERENLLLNITPGKWKPWGMMVLADQDGSGDVNNAVDVAQTLQLDDAGKPRTWDAKLICATQQEAAKRVSMDRITASLLRGLAADKWDERHYEALVLAETILKEN